VLGSFYVANDIDCLCFSSFRMCSCFGKIKRYLELYATTGALPSNLFQGEAAKVRTFAIVVSSVLFNPAQFLVECPLFFFSL
jgi:hypothetical protein